MGAQNSNSVGFTVGSEEIVYYHTDELESVRMLTDAYGQIYPTPQTRYDYLPFGTLWAAPSHKDRRQR